MTRKNLMKLVWLRAKLAREAAVSTLKDKAPTSWGFYQKLVWWEFGLDKAALLAAPTHAEWHRKVIRGHYECLFLIRQDRAKWRLLMAEHVVATEQPTLARAA